MTDSCWAILLAAGKDQEFKNGADAAFMGIGNRPSIACVSAAVEACREIDGMAIVAPRERMEMIGPIGFRFGLNKIRVVVPGVSRRIANIQNAWNRVEDKAGWVVILDVCRPMVTSTMIADTLCAARSVGAAAMAGEILDPVRIVSRPGTHAAAAPGAAWAIQSPQAFSAAVFRKVLTAGLKKKTVDVDLVGESVSLGCPVRLVPSPNLNLRIRSADDLAIAAHFAAEKRM